MLQRGGLQSDRSFRIIMARTDERNAGYMKQFRYVTTRTISAREKTLERLMRECARFASSVTLRGTDEHASVLRLRDLLGCGIRGGSRITVTVEGMDEEAAVAAVQNYIVANF